MLLNSSDLLSVWLNHQLLSQVSASKSKLFFISQLHIFIRLILMQFFQSGSSYCSRVTTWSSQHPIGQSSSSGSPKLWWEIKVSYRTISSEVEFASLEEFVRRGAGKVSWNLRRRVFILFVLLWSKWDGKRHMNKCIVAVVTYYFESCAGSSSCAYARRWVLTYLGGFHF